MQCLITLELAVPQLIILNHSSYKFLYFIDYAAVILQGRLCRYPYFNTMKHQQDETFNMCLEAYRYETIPHQSNLHARRLYPKSRSTIDRDRNTLPRRFDKVDIYADTGICIAIMHCNIRWKIDVNIVEVNSPLNQIIHPAQLMSLLFLSTILYFPSHTLSFPLLSPILPRSLTTPPDPALKHGWQSAPDGRGTVDLVLSCLTTLSLCVWTAVHLNICPADNVWKSSGRQILWMLLAMFAPEVVLFCAWRQYWEAASLKRKINSMGEAVYSNVPSVEVCWELLRVSMFYTDSCLEHQQARSLSLFKA